MGKSKPINRNKNNVASASDNLNINDGQLKEEDKNVQDVLQSLNAETYVVEPQLQQRLQEQQRDRESVHDSIDSANADNGANAANTGDSDGAQFEKYEDNSVFPFPIPISSSTMNDIKMSLVCVSIFFIVSQIPLEKIVFNYIALDKIPLSGIMIKGIIAGLLFFIISRILSLTSF